MTFRRAHRRVTRVVRGELHTAVQTWTRGPDHRIVLIGMSHVGEPDYFDTVRRVVASHPGATVHYERVVREDPLPPMTDDEWARLDAARRSHRFVLRWAAEVAELGTQHGLAVDGWHNVDVNEVDLARMSGRSMPRLAVPGVRMGIDYAPPLTDRQRRVLRHVVRLLLVHIAPRGRLLMRPMTRRAVVQWRNVHAMTHALRAVHDGPVVMIWGAGHLPGIGDVLLHNDFRLESVRWVRAVGRMRSPEGAPVTGEQPGEELKVSVKVYNNGQVGTS
ncbi:hypothetical protein [Saccharothrix texasensis]|uniref:Uncharacterized protein n=1 Tax=Saccharothrix texasensis TaxID=103734 RepID=A0A3N1H435_9PSEU|nr:hypothetical protein [Saccharothrix texasensis]ROP37280.1 hypothetical protein EDD40_2584 [Saccharothrix texasensis]